MDRGGGGGWIGRRRSRMDRGEEEEEGLCFVRFMVEVCQDNRGKKKIAQRRMYDKLCLHMMLVDVKSEALPPISIFFANWETHISIT